MSSGVDGVHASLPLRKSLRGKYLFGMLALVAYLLASGLHLASERAAILVTLDSLGQLAQHEKALALAEAAVNGAEADLGELRSAGPGAPANPGNLAPYVESSRRMFRTLESYDPSYALIQRSIERSYGAAAAAPLHSNWIDLREALKRASAELEIRRSRLADRRDTLAAGARRQHDAVTVEGVALAIVGMAVFGSLAAWFFSGLAGDVRRLEAHARRVVRGARGVALDVRRDDELGQLMHAVNRMASDLDEREKQIQVESQRHSHHDKMLAVGALAAGIAHEVNNPLAVVTGVVQDLRATPGEVTTQMLDESAQLILAQVERAARAARHLADAAAPEAAAEDWLDINAIIRRVVQLAGYDRRYRAIGIELALEPSLPAIRSTGSAVQQVLIQVLTMACDALVATARAPAWLQLATQTEAAGIAVRLEAPAELDFARAEVQRSLLLSRAIIEPLRGRLAFGQAGADRMAIKLTFPALAGATEG